MKNIPPCVWPGWCVKTCVLSVCSCTYQDTQTILGSSLRLSVEKVWGRTWAPTCSTVRCRLLPPRIGRVLIVDNTHHRQKTQHTWVPKYILRTYRARTTLGRVTCDSDHNKQIRAIPDPGTQTGGSFHISVYFPPSDRHHCRLYLPNKVYIPSSPTYTLCFFSRYPRLERAEYIHTSTW